MRQRLHHRLQELEDEAARVRSLREATQQQAAVEDSIRRIKLFLRIRGVEQTATESLFEAFARALEIGTRELRAQMLEGVQPIKKWFSDNGIYEEIERRKAAATWPDG